MVLLLLFFFKSLKSQRPLKPTLVGVLLGTVWAPPPVPLAAKSSIEDWGLQPTAIPGAEHLRQTQASLEPPGVPSRPAPRGSCLRKSSVLSFFFPLACQTEI